MVAISTPGRVSSMNASCLRLNDWQSITLNSLGGPGRFRYPIVHRGFPVPFLERGARSLEMLRRKSLRTHFPDGKVRKKKPPQSVVRCGGFFRMHKVIKEIGSFLSGVLRLMEERLDFASDPAGAAAGEPASH